MKIIRFDYQNAVRYGVVDGEDNVLLIEGNPYGELRVTKKLTALSDVKLLSPCDPQIIVAIGVNYPAHPDENKRRDAGGEPSVFFKAASCVIGHLESIIYPKISTHVTCAGELAVVMKSKASHVTEHEALNHVLGYTCANDVFAIDISKKDIMPTRAKSFHTFCPLGPWIVTDIDGGNLRIKSRLNGVLMQDASTSEMIFDIRRIIAFVTGFMTLQPGDVIITGSSRTLIDNTLHAGDRIQIEIEKIGILENKVISMGNGNLTGKVV